MGIDSRLKKKDRVWFVIPLVLLSIASSSVILVVLGDRLGGEVSISDDTVGGGGVICWSDVPMTSARSRSASANSNSSWNVGSMNSVGNKIGAYVRVRPLPIIPAYRWQVTRVARAS